MIWLIVGIILFPYWFFRLFYRGGFWSAEFWFDGIRSIFFYIFFDPIVLIGLVGLYFLAKKKIIDIKIPEIDFFSSFKKTTIPLFLSVVAGIFIWTIPMKSGYDYDQNLDNDVPLQTNYERKIKTPLDFIYINKERVDNLFEQIKPELILREKQLESQTEEGKEISSGDNPVLTAKRSEKNQNKQTDIYSAVEISDPKKVTELLNHFYSSNTIKEYQTLELSAEDVKKLESLRTISQQFHIPYDNTKFVRVYDRVIGESLIKEHSAMKVLSGQVVIKGDFLVSINEDKILLKHNYFQIDDNNRITFSVSTLKKSEKISGALGDAGQNNKAMNLSIFGKVTRVESNDKVTDIYFDAYAIW